MVELVRSLTPESVAPAILTKIFAVPPNLLLPEYDYYATRMHRAGAAVVVADKLTTEEGSIHAVHCVPHLGRIRSDG